MRASKHGKRLSLTGDLSPLSFLIAIMVCAGLTLGVARAQAPQETPQSLLAAARAKAGSGQIDSALEIYRRLVKLLPSDPSVKRDLAGLLGRTKETRAEAEKFYAEAVKLLPHDAGLALERARNFTAGGDGVNAVLEYRRAFEMIPNSTAAIDGYIREVSRLGAAPNQIEQYSKKAANADDIVSRLILAELLRSEARYNESLEYYWNALRRAPKSAIALRGAVAALLALGSSGEAEKLIERGAWRGGPRELITERARIYGLSGRPEAALNLLLTNSGVSEEPRPQIVLADVYRRLGQLKEERATLEKILARSEDEDFAVLERMARVQYELGEKDSARTLCDRLLEKEPNNRIGMFGLALLNNSAIEKINEEPQAASPARMTGHYQELGEAALFWNQPDLALLPLRRALTGRPGAPRLLLDIGQALLQKKEGAGAVEVFGQLPLENGPRLDAMFGMGEAELLRGQPERALNIYEYILERDPANFLALTKSAEALQRTGKNERAAVILQALNRRSPESLLIREQLRLSLDTLGRSYLSVAMPGSAAAEAAGPAKGQLFQGEIIEPLLRPGDVVTITVSGSLNISSKVRLDERGKLRPNFLAEEISANCLTAGEVSAGIVKAGASRLANSQVEIRAADLQVPPLVVAGAVYLPGAYQIRRYLDLQQSLMLAGGPNNKAGRSVYIIRGTGKCDVQTRNTNTEQVEEYERTAVEDGRIKFPKPLGAGDSVIVPENDAAFLTGAFVRPGALRLKGAQTLLSAVQSVGGTKSDAVRQQVKLFRLAATGIHRQQLLVNLAEIENGKARDVILQPGDVIEVKSSKGKKAETSLAEILTSVAPETPTQMTEGTSK